MYVLCPCMMLSHCVLCPVSPPQTCLGEKSRSILYKVDGKPQFGAILKSFLGDGGDCPPLCCSRRGWKKLGREGAAFCAPNSSSFSSLLRKREKEQKKNLSLAGIDRTLDCKKSKKRLKMQNFLHFWENWACLLRKRMWAIWSENSCFCELGRLLAVRVIAHPQGYIPTPHLPFLFFFPPTSLRFPH